MLNLVTVNSWSFQGEAIASSFDNKWIQNFLAFFSKAVTHKEKFREISDDACVKKIAQGDSDTFEVLFDRYGDLVYGYCRKILKDVAVAEDASQEAWVKVISNASKYQPQGKFRAWLMQVTRNVCLSLLRTKNKHIPTEDIDDFNEEISQEDFFNEIVQKKEKQQLQDHILNLPENQRVAILIWMTEEKSYFDIAKHMGTTVSSVKSLIFRGRETLIREIRKK